MEDDLANSGGESYPRKLIVKVSEGNLTTIKALAHGEAKTPEELVEAWIQERIERIFETQYEIPKVSLSWIIFGFVVFMAAKKLLGRRSRKN